MSFNIEIFLNGLPYKVDTEELSYEQVVKIWNEVHRKEGEQIIGTPSVEYHQDAGGKDGILLPGKSVKVTDGTAFSVSPDQIGPDKPDHFTIYLNGEPYEVADEVMSYDQVVNAWNELHKREGVYIKGTPGIDYQHGVNNERDILWPGRSVKIVTGISFIVSPEHIA